MDTKPTFLGLIITGALACCLLAACSPESSPAGPTLSPVTVSTPSRAAHPPGRLTPFASATAPATPAPSDPSTPTALPSPTPTLRSHTVAKGEDMFGIAWRYRVTLEDLQAANPEVNPNFLSIGAKLTIPPSSELLPTSESPQPTPIPLQIGQMTCAATPEGGAWCFLPVFNPQGFALENVSAVFRLADREATTILPQTAFLPLDVLPSGSTLPLVAYFPPPLPEPFVYSAELAMALPHPTGDGRYVEAVVENVEVNIDENGLSASVDCQVDLAETGSKAQTVRLAAVAYDSQGNVVGLRRWEMETGQALSGGEPMAVRVQVYSVSDPIAQVEVMAEARP